jgi:hypothetical protein
MAESSRDPALWAFVGRDAHNRKMPQRPSPTGLRPRALVPAGRWVGEIHQSVKTVFMFVNSRMPALASSRP